IKGSIRKLELASLQKEQSEEYRKLLEMVSSHFDSVKTKLDIIGKKSLLKLVFKSIKIEDGKVKNFELFEPFKSLYKGVKINCQIPKTQKVIAMPDCVSTYALTDAR
ncbi:MAG: hypothetical protein JW928_08485, partial [Candidatus Aureabacteria bacterium]|nr:hypothetical protein [Candidatus Auribacterota bacterium]